jgi:hypothetical protein
MKNRKMVFAFLLCTVLYAAVFAQNQSDFKTDGGGTITKYEGWDTKIVIPAQIGGVPVTGIGNGAFRNMGITSVTLPAGINRIGERAFADNKLTTVTIPANVGIEKNAFSNNQLTSLTTGNGCTIDDRAFSDNRLTNLTIGNGCTINRYPFSTDNLKNIVLGANINFGEETFGIFVFFEYIFNGKKAGTYGAQVQEKKEGDYQFYETKYGSFIVSYTGNEGNRLIIPGKLGNAAVKGIYSFNIEIGPFMNKGISRMQLPNTLIYIGSRGFWGNQLTSVTIPASVTTIMAEAFDYNNQLTSVTFEGKDIDISPYAFPGDLSDKYLASDGGTGTYIRFAGSRTWLKLE